MQLARPGAVLASQTINITVRPHPTGGANMTLTEREYRLSGECAGIGTFANLIDAVAAARQLSRGSMPGLAIVRWRNGFRLHDVHTASRTYVATSTHAPVPPMQREMSRSSVPFAAGNIRVADPDAPTRNNPALVVDPALVALIDGDRSFMPGADHWAGKPRLVERSS